MKTIFEGCENKPGVYKIYNKLNGRIYIGSAKEFVTRYNKHLCILRKNKHYNNFLQHDYNKCGEENFVFEVLERTTEMKEVRIKLEQKYLDLYYDDQRQCYNICPIAKSSLGRKWKQTSKEKASKYWIEFYKINQHRLKGRPRSEETKRKMSENQKGEKNHAFGKPVSEEVKKKRIEGINKARAEGRLNGNRGKIPWNKGKQQSERQRIQHSERMRKVFNTTVISPTGVVFTLIDNLKEFCKYHKLHYGCFNMVLNGKRKTHKGWRKDT